MTRSHGLVYTTNPKKGLRMSLNQVALPQPEEAELARESASVLAKFLASAPAEERAYIKLSDEDLILPRKAIELLKDILSGMSKGDAVTIMPLHAEMTTQAAADFLNVSRPHLVKLLESNKIPFVKVGTHRRIKLQDLVSYKEQRYQESMKAMDELAELSQEYNMGY